MFHISYCLRVLLVAMVLMVLMALPALAGAPPAPKPSPPVPMVPSPTNPAILVECPPCEFCNMYRVNPHGPKVAAPQLQGASPTANYAPTYLPSGSASAQPMQHTPAQPMQYAQPQQAPGTYAVGGYVSNQPMPAGPNPSLGEVWMRHGGARLQYDALRGPIQMNTNGRPLKDPALVHAPPLYPKPRVVRPRAVQPKPKVTATKKVTPAPAVVKNNASPKPVAKPMLTPAKPASPLLTKPKAEVVAPKVAPKTEPAPTAKAPAPASPAESAAPARAIPRTASPTMLEDYGPEGISRPAGSVSSPYDGPAQAVGS